MRAVLPALLLVASGAWSEAITGTLQSDGGAAIPGAFLALLSPAFEPLDTAISAGDGSFRFSRAPQDAMLVAQPPATLAMDGVNAFRHAPRIFSLEQARSPLALTLPESVSLVIVAHDRTGRVMRWRDFQALGEYGGQFLYVTNLDDEMREAAVWPVHGRLTGADGGPREEGLPAALVPPGEACALRVLFWPTAGYGKLNLRVDNAGAGFRLDSAEDNRTLYLNLELARTAVQDLVRRMDRYPEAAAGAIRALELRIAGIARIEDRADQARAADDLLVEALRLRDALEIEAARARIPRLRQGTLEVQLAEVDAPESWRIEIEQVRRDFLFGVFEGSPYNARAFEIAREAGFELATILPGWAWTENPRARRQQIDQVFGIGALNALDYEVKAHGVVWIQDYGILPERAKGMEPAALEKALLEHQAALLGLFEDAIGTWEAMNEPAATNTLGLPRERMFALMDGAARNIQAAGRPTLVNSPHELSHGAKFFLYGVDGRPTDDYALTYSDFLKRAEAAGALEAIDIIGLQFYPGFHLNEGWGHLQGPAQTPAHLIETVDRYTRFGRPLHITELSFPSSYGADWFSGYWREPWTETTQADYAEAVFTLAFGHPQVESITWWDVMDTKPAVITGGLVHDNGAPKPAFERIRALLDAWTTREEHAPGAGGEAAFTGFAGRYRVTAHPPSGSGLAPIEAEAVIRAGETAPLTLRADAHE